MVKDLANSEKNIRKMSNRFEFPEQKVEEIGMLIGLKFAFEINFTQTDFSWIVNVQIARVQCYSECVICK